MKIIGRADQADFPELFLQNIRIKVDTGAYTSSIHCHEIKENEIEGKKHIEFKVMDPSHLEYNDKVFKVNDYKIKKIKNSFGKTESRYIIKTKIIIFDKVYPIELSLSGRSEMKYPVLLGRKFLNKKFIVNTSVQNISYRLKQENE